MIVVMVSLEVIQIFSDHEHVIYNHNQQKLEYLIEV